MIHSDRVDRLVRGLKSIGRLMPWLKSKNASEKPGDVFVVVFKAPGVPGFEEQATREQALEAFEQCIAKGYFTPGLHRRMYVTGPDYCVQPDDPDDPLLIGPAAIRAVLTPEEYAALPQVRTVEYGLVAE